MELLALFGTLVVALLVAALRYASKVGELEEERDTLEKRAEAVETARQIRAVVDQLPDDDIQRRVLLNSR